MPEDSSGQRRVLFVDDDAAFLEMISRAFAQWSRGAWQPLTAENAGKALGLLQDYPTDLVVIDVQMPVVDGLQFLQLLARKHPNLLKVVLTGFATEANRAACMASGAEVFLEKPRDQGGLETVFSMLHELARVPTDQGFRGVLRRVGLQDVLQMECLSRHSVVLEVAAGTRKGQIYVEEGSIIHAQFGEATGETAFNELLALGGGEFNLRPFADPPARSIDGQWEFLLMEAARRRDEAAEVASAQPTAPPPAPTAGWDAFEPEPGREVTATAASGIIHEDVFPPQIDEVLVCSAQGDLLYEWQSPNAENRITFLEFLSQKSRQLALALPLGRFDRLEVTADRARFVAQVQADRGIIVRSSRGALQA